MRRKIVDYGFKANGSGWVLKRGTSYIPTPMHINRENVFVLLNVKNKETQYPPDDGGEKADHYLQCHNKLYFTGIQFLVRIDDIPKT